MNGSSTIQPRPTHASLGPGQPPHSASPSIERIATVLILASLVCGVFLRLAGLGDHQLSTIEFYFVTSARSILETGLPGLPGGGFYHPGLVAQYVAAAFAGVLGDNEFAYRLPGALFSLATIALTYAFGRPRLGPVLASTVCAALLLSSWNIEFARLARPYALFQCVTMLLLVAIDRSWRGGRGRGRYVPHVLVLLAALTSEFPPVLMPLLWLPYLASQTVFREQRDRLRYGIVTAAVSLVVVFMSRADFRTYNVPNPLPVDVAPETRDWLELPTFPFWGFDASASLGLALALLVGGVALAHFRNLRRGGSRLGFEQILGLSLVVAALFHNLLLVAGLAAMWGVLVIRRCGLSVRLLDERRFLAVLFAAGVVVLAWISFAFMTTDWIAVAGKELGYESFVGGLRIAFFGWPNLYDSLFVPWSRGMPRLGVFVTIACGVELLALASASPERIPKSPAVVLLIIAAAMGVFAAEDRTLGSSFFIYPLALVVLASAASRMSRWLLLRFDPSRTSSPHALAAVAFAGLILVSSDFNPSHLTQIRSPEVGYRMGDFQDYAPIWSPRRDVRSAARYVESVLDPEKGERLLVQGLPAASLYLTKPHSVYYGREGLRFPRVSRAAGSQDVWSKQPLLSMKADVDAVCRSSSTIWVLRPAGNDLEFCRHVWPRVQEEVAHRGYDGRIEVVRLDAVPRGDPGTHHPLSGREARGR